MTTVYKAMRVDEGVLKSVWARDGTGLGLERFKGVTYIEGQVSYAPEGQQGLSTFGELDEAITFCKFNNSHGYPMVIHEATPLGAESPRHEVCSQKSARTYPAILLGKEVWTDKPKEPKFKVGDVVVVKDPLGAYRGVKVGMRGVVKDAHNQSSLQLAVGDREHGNKKGGYYVQSKYLELAPKSTEQERLCEARTLLGGDIKTCTRTRLSIISKDRHYTLYAAKDGLWSLYEGSRGRVLSTQSLKDVEVFIKEDTPVEEWVDVTKECTTKIGATGFKGGGYYIVIKHNGKSMASIGISGKHFIAPSGYKVEEVTDTDIPFTYFKILKKVTK